MSGSINAGNYLSANKKKKDAMYEIEYKEDGVFITIDYGEIDGEPLHPEVVLYDIRRRNILGTNEAEIRANIKRHRETMKLADAQEENETESDVMAFVARDFMSAQIVLFPPCRFGTMKSVKEVVEILKEKWNINYGLDDRVIRDLINHRVFTKSVIIANGKLPENGEDGTAIFLFKTKPDYSPKISEDGSADYKNLSVFESVQEGDEVGTIIPPGEGVKGYNVHGEVIEPKRGAEAKLPKLVNVKISEDGEKLIAQKSGRIDFIGNTIAISDVYKISGDVDMKVGNVDFDGDVIITGNVISGLSVKATGLIEVWGYVEGATLTAGKDIILKNGMQGMEKGKLIAGGNIVARFVEHSDIKASGDITSDYIVHCDAMAGGSITMKGKWGKIVGGHISAEKLISAVEVGSVSNEHTIIEMGISPEERARYNDLLALRDGIRAQLEKVNMAAKMFAGKQVASDRQEMRDKLIAAQGQLEQQYSEAVKEIETLDKIMSTSSGAKLNASKAVYPNVKLIIDSAMTTTRKLVGYATFRYSKGEVVYGSYEG